ncbi:hypothetical protein FF011L_22350 [Roseimaritima multifibrata]|uniref:Uncharacterized protein n=1 Tax=Roseimaritima multifibrata TaxID=1930274 RepID=A0A517MEZ6_9BACT|nr:hypothetical protein FF011L_22350 [Roseimaritima multifibrata]
MSDGFNSARPSLSAVVLAQRATDKPGSVARWAFLFAIPTPKAYAASKYLSPSGLRVHAAPSRLLNGCKPVIY